MNDSTDISGNSRAPKSYLFIAASRRRAPFYARRSGRKHDFGANSDGGVDGTPEKS